MAENRFSFLFEGLEEVSYPLYQAEQSIRSVSPGGRPNAFSFLKAVYLESRTPGTYRDLVFRLESDLPGFSFKDIHLSRLALGEKAMIDDYSYALDEDFLYRLPERRDIVFRASLYNGPTVIATHEAKGIALPLSEALDHASDPVLLASYVTPEDAALDRLYEKGARKAKEEKLSLSGYEERDPNLVLSAAECLYEALREEEIALLQPASKSSLREKVRLPYLTLAEKKGTSLDIALVYASLLERSGLHPLVFLYRDKAAVGIWLEESLFASGFTDNPSPFLVAASKGYDQLLVIDPSSSLSPEEARAKGYNDLESGSLFAGAIDVLTCRKEHILPLPTPGREGKVAFPSFEKQGEGKLSEIDLSTHRYIDSEDRGDKNRYDHWLDKLLDLNLKNRLINLRPGRSLPQLLVPDAEKFLDLLKENKKLVLAPYESYVAREKKGEAIIDFPPSYFGTIAKDSYEKGVVPFLVGSGEASDDLVKSLSRRSNTALEESGSNPLFLTVGLLRYFDNEKAAARGKGAMYAPILLLPIRIPLRKAGPHFSFEYDYDEITVNTTLFEYLKQAFGIDLGPLEGTIRRKDGQVDLRLIYNYIRGKIASHKGFALLENASGIGLFSFAHFVMWDDLRRRKNDLLSNPHIASMVAGKVSFREPEGLLSKDEFDSREEFLPLPLPADSSQIKAIDDALRGASFVMDGPPGTGKSQTIANMICAFLSGGKKVLFVPEKEVALEVVKKRLDQIGLGRFALFLSSSRTAKGDVLKALGELIGLGMLTSDASFEEAKERLSAKTKELNSLLSSLHGRKRYLFSIEEAIDLYLSSLEGQGFYRFSLDEARGLDETRYQEAVESLARLARSDEKVNGHLASPFRPYVGESYSLLIREKLMAALQGFLELDQELYLAEHNAALAIGDIKKTRQNASIIAEIAEVDRSLGGLFGPYFSAPSTPSRDAEIRSSLALLDDAEKRRAKILSRFKESVFTLPREAVVALGKEFQGGGFFARSRAKKDLQKLLLPHLVVRRKASKKEIAFFLEAFDGLTFGPEEALAKRLELESFLGPISLKEENLLARFDATAKMAAKVDELVASSAHPSRVRAKLASSSRPFGSEAAYRLADLYKEHEEKASALLKECAFDLRLYEDDDDYYKKEKARIADCLAHEGEMASYFGYLEACLEASTKVPSSFLELFKAGKIPPSKLVKAYQNALSLLLVSAAASEEGVASLSHEEIEKLLSSYADDLRAYQEASIAECASKITAKYPSPSAGTAASSDLYRLRKFIANGGRGISLRTLLREFGGLISTLCPCYLMSPLSVAQFLRPEDRFDIVIFDEASQIPTSEAIGSISHAEAIVVAGDQMQMPPTDFFKATITGVEEGEESFQAIDEDLESLLDDVIVMGYPRNRLTFHYRSRNENLIAFSNERFYGNSLFTFPSPRKEGTGVSFRKVKGAYQPGRGINRPEAEALVEEVARRLSDPQESRRSIGIVTFNEAQQNLILDLLEKKDPSAFAEKDGREPVFVKNLENVQGDERDVIFFSTTYGPDRKGSFSINFGPLSREKGERRLNVAITRAREEMIVFSSFDPEEIRAERAKNAGARYLRDFLFFARDGVKALYKVPGSAHYESRGEVARHLASDLRKLGYEVEEEVGTSLFRVDLAVKDEKGDYALGILLDGASYLGAATCEDRNLVQPSILANLGWNFVRFYAIEYFDHPKEMVKEIVNLLNAPKERPAPKKLEVPSFAQEEVSLAPNKVNYRRYEGHPEGEDEAAKVLAVVKGVIADEAPVALTLVEKRVREALGLKAMTSKYRSYVGMALEALRPVRENYPNEGTFLYPEGTDPRSYSYYRLDKSAGRSVEEISFVELGNLYKDILLVEGRLYKEDLVKMALQRLGATFKKKGNDHLLLALKAAVSDHRGLAYDDDGYVVLARPAGH